MKEIGYYLWFSYREQSGEEENCVLPLLSPEDWTGLTAPHTTGQMETR